MSPAERMILSAAVDVARRHELRERQLLTRIDNLVERATRAERKAGRLERKCERQAEYIDHLKRKMVAV